MNKLRARRIAQTLLTAPAVYIVSHRQPDADTLGSALALWWWLKSQGRQSFLYCVDPVPKTINFLPGSDFFSAQLTTLPSAEAVVIFVDCSALNHTGLTKDYLAQNPTTINLDHHVTNGLYADLNLVEIRASSTCELFFRFFQELNVTLTPTLATCLLAGIITDTGGLTFSNTSLTTFNITSALLAAGGKLPLITQAVTKNKSLTALQLWGVALNRLKKTSTGLVYTLITAGDLAQSTEGLELIEGLANFLNSLHEGRAVLVLREVDGKIKGSLRTTKETINVAKLAQSLGGGGHRQAAGFTLNGQLRPTQTGWQII